MKKIWLAGLTILMIGLLSNLGFAQTADEYYREGYNYYEQKNYKQAAKSFEKAAELEPDNATYHYNLGIIYSNSGKYKEALKHLEKAVKLDPESQAGELAKEQIPGIKEYLKEAISYSSGVKPAEKAINSVREVANWSASPWQTIKGGLKTVSNPQGKGIVVYAKGGVGNFSVHPMWLYINGRVYAINGKAKTMSKDRVKFATHSGYDIDIGALHDYVYE